jgi:LacI family transcriptional regulator
LLRKITIDHIARELDVANSTVSRALRDDPRISERLRQEVKRVAARMGYVPNIAARSLRTGESQMIGFLVRDIRDGLSTELMPGVEDACAERGYGLLVCSAADDPSRERYYLHMLQQRRVDGILVLTPLSSSPEPYLSATDGIPLVLMDLQLDDSPLCAVAVDHVLGAYLATRHLLDLGHRRIALLSGPLHLQPCSQTAKGYKMAMSEAGLGPEEHLVVVRDKTGIADGYAGMQDILRISPQPTGILTVSDLMAAGALDAAHEFGIGVPRDMSIVGYDDIPMGALLSPPLTTIVQDKETLARLSVELLLEEIRGGEHQHRQVLLPPALKVRGSTGPVCPEHEPLSGNGRTVSRRLARRTA